MITLVPFPLRASIPHSLSSLVSLFLHLIPIPLLAFQSILHRVCLSVCVHCVSAFFAVFCSARADSFGSAAVRFAARCLCVALVCFCFCFCFCLCLCLCLCLCFLMSFHVISCRFMSLSHVALSCRSLMSPSLPVMSLRILVFAFVRYFHLILIFSVS